MSPDGPPSTEPAPPGSGPASGPPPGAEPPASSGTRTPLDADDTRSTHLARLARHPLAISLSLTAAIAAFVVGTHAAGAAIGAAAAGGALLLAAVILFAVATGRAKEDFLNAYADARGLTRTGKGRLAAATPLLRRGDKRYATMRMDGTLPGGEIGTLAHYTYEETSTDSEGHSSTTYVHFTVALCQVPESATRIGELYCQRRVGFRFLDGFEDAFRRKQRIEVESEVMDRRFETFADPDCDPNWLRQLFTPSFILWLAEEAPKNFAFELVAGALCANVKGHADSAGELDAICEATSRVATRLREEASEPAVGGIGA